jgi:predicted nucleic acid-binding protein
MNYILDTNVVLEIVKRDPGHHNVHWVELFDPPSVIHNVITAGEFTINTEPSVLNPWEPLSA